MSSLACETASQCALLRLQNMLVLLKDLNLSNSVGFKVLKDDLATGDDAAREYLVIVHVRSDSTFSRYFKSACGADMALFRGMFLKLGMGTTEAGKPCISSAAVHQAFLPKFENEGQDTDIAAGIQRASEDRYMTVSVKHSGSLATMSHDLLGAKNSQGNVYTAVAGLLLQAHYERVANADKSLEATKLMTRLREAMKAKRLSVSFEVVARCLSHHGQLPQAEYLVTTAITRLCADGRIEVLPLIEHLAFCKAHYLPVNDVWLFARSKAAAAASQALDGAAHSALPTGPALQALDSVVGQYPSDAVRIRGTYPHSLWQGSRIEGFVVSQGSQITDNTHSDLNDLARSFQNMYLNPTTEAASKESSKKSKGAENCAAEGALGRVGIAGGADMGAGGGISADMLKRLRKEVADVAPDTAPLLGQWKPAPNKEADEVLKLLHGAQPHLEGVCLHASENEPPLPSRKALEALRQGGSRGADADALAAARPELKEVLAAATAPQEGKGAARKALNQALQALMGPLAASRGLRYKKKLWSYRIAGDPVPPSLAAAGATAQVPPHVAYCMMTFILRNGLRSLKESKSSYRDYVNALVKRWGMAAEEAGRVRLFAHEWAEWVYSKGLVRNIQGETYLAQAEEFVREFLTKQSGPGAARDAPASFAAVGPLDTPRGGYTGVALLVGFDDATVAEVASRVHARGVGSKLPKKWLQEHSDDGWILGLSPMDGKVVVDKKAWWPEVAPVLKIVHRPLPNLQNGNSKAAKKLKAQDRTALESPKKVLEDFCSANSIDIAQRFKIMHAWPQNVPNSVTAVPSGKSFEVEALVQEVTEWLGSGVAPPPPDPAVIVTFAGIPGLGKTELCARLQARLADRHTVVHHHSDALEPKARKGFWDNAAKLSVTRRGAGSSTVVLADKNLVDNPAGNWDSVSGTLAASGTRTMAVFLTDAASAERATSAARSADDADSPFSMEQFALAMLRVGLRQKHVGKLDARLPQALRILSAFGGTYRARAPADVLRNLQNLFDDVLVVPVTKKESSGGPLDPKKYKQLMSLVERGFALGDFRQGRGETLSDKWETELRALLHDTDVQKYLNGLSCDLEEEAAMIERAVEASIATARAARSPPPPTAQPPTAAATAAAAAAATAAAPAASAAAAAAAAAAQAAAKLPPTLPPPQSGRKGKDAASKSANGGASGRSSACGEYTLKGSTQPQPPQSAAAAATPAAADAATAAAAKAAQNMANLSIAGGAKPAAAVAAAAAAAAGARSFGGAQGSAAAPGAAGAAAAAKAAAAQAANAMNLRRSPTSSSVGVAAATTSAAVDLKLSKCVYACVASFNRAAVHDAFAAAQKAAGIPLNRLQKSKPELHVTLWHKSSGDRGRGRACVAADGETVKFAIVGFDVSDRISAARVRKLDELEQHPRHLSADDLKIALDVAAPHITLWFANGVPPKEAGKLQGMHAAGDPSVKFIPLPEPLELTGRVCLR